MQKTKLKKLDNEEINSFELLRFVYQRKTILYGKPTRAGIG
jgi:hypothetical protein